MRNNEGYKHDWTTEYLAGVSDAGLPPHEICLKVGAPIIAMRNIMKGVVNGTRMIVTFVDDGLKFIRAKLLSESGTRQREVLITKSSSRWPGARSRAVRPPTNAPSSPSASPMR